MHISVLDLEGSRSYGGSLQQVTALQIFRDNSLATSNRQCSEVKRHEAGR